MSVPETAPGDAPGEPPTARGPDAPRVYDELSFDRAPVLRTVARGEPSAVRAFLFGLGAAFLGALVYFVVRTLTGYELGLIAIGVGVVVGIAVRAGASGSPHRGFRVLALSLAYVSIAATYVPALIGASESQHVTIGLLVGALLFALTIPFTLLKHGEVMSAIIVGIALWEAWRFSAPKVVAVQLPNGPSAPSP